MSLGIFSDFASHFHKAMITDYAFFSSTIRMSFKSGFDTIPTFNGTNWLSWSSRMSQFLMAQKLWTYTSSLITKPALELTAAATTTTCHPTTAKSIKARNEWISEDSAAIGYIKMKCTESVVASISASDKTSQKVWDSLKAKYDKASVAVVLEEIRKAFGFRLSGGDPTGEISQLAAMLE